MPDVSGLLWTDAEPQLRALGWTGVLDRGPDVDAVASQHNESCIRRRQPTLRSTWTE